MVIEKEEEQEEKEEEAKGKVSKSEMARMHKFSLKILKTLEKFKTNQIVRIRIPLITPFTSSYIS